MTALASRTNDALNYAHSAEWKRHSRHFHALLAESGLTIAQGEVVKQALRDRFEVSSTRELTPEQYGRVVSSLAAMTLAERSRFFASKLDATTVTTAPTPEAAVTAASAHRSEGMHELDLESTRVLRRALAPFADEASMALEDGTQWIVETDCVEATIYLPARLDAPGTIKISQHKTRRELVHLMASMQAITKRAA